MGNDSAALQAWVRFVGCSKEPRRRHRGLRVSDLQTASAIGLELTFSFVVFGL